MSALRSSWIRLAAPAAAAALLLTACGSDDSAEQSDDAGQSSESAEEDEDLSDTDDAGDPDDDLGDADDLDDDTGGDGAAYAEVQGLDPVTGDVAVGEWAGPLFVDPDEEAQIWVRVDKVHVGDPSDLDVFEEDDYSDYRPVYAWLTAVNAGETDHDEVGLGISFVDSAGDGATSFSYWGGEGLPGDCGETSTTTYVDLNVGDEAEVCQYALIPADAELGEITYNPYYGSADQRWVAN